MASPKVGYTRGAYYSAFRFQPNADHFFSMLDEVRHTSYRNRISSGHAGSNLMEEKVGKQVTRLINLIERRFVSTESNYRPMELASIAHFFAMDVIVDVTFGNPFGFLDDGEDVFGYLKWNEAFFPGMIPATVFPEMANILHMWPLTHMFPKDTDKIGLGRFVRVDHRYSSEKDKKQRDMMGMFFSQGVTREEAINEAILQVVAGTDSVSTPICMTILCLISTPPVRTKLLAELDVAVAAGQTSNPITEAEARRLPYLQAIIREGVRMFPGATPSAFKKVPPGGDVISGLDIPEGTLVGTNIWGMLRSKKYWGDDADRFMPERWLQASEEQLEIMNAVLEVQFGFGKYKCMGRPLVFMELNRVLPELLRRYEFTVINVASPLSISMLGST